MPFNNNFKKITVAENGIILTYRTKKPKELLFSELDNAHVKVNKIKPVYKLTLILTLLILEFLFYLYLQAELILLISLFLIVVTALLMTKYKSYGIKLRLKDGNIIEEKILTKLKLETIDVINEVQKGIYNYKINLYNN